MRSLKKVKPPETSSVFSPAALAGLHEGLDARVQPQALVVDLLQRRLRHAASSATRRRRLSL
jgi:hypothetical protein